MYNISSIRAISRHLVKISRYPSKKNPVFRIKAILKHRSSLCFSGTFLKGPKETNRFFFPLLSFRQGVFYYQVSLDHYHTEEFLQDAFLRYKMYLYLKQQNTQQFLVPCYDIDLIWHTHQVHTLHYSKDTTAILGFVLKHDDSVNDR